jgi:tRNA pseudouridine55 synthase
MPTVTVDGVLVVDKPQGLTSHDVVAAARRALGEKRIGHTGTLDPLATGVLPLAVGRATRLVRFLSASDKDYDATIRFGLTTDSYDATGVETNRTDRAPTRDALQQAIDSLTGDYLQLPPDFSAKKTDGRRAYSLARLGQPVTLTPVPVRVSRAALLDLTGDTARVAITCSAGFYVRSFAHALGELTGTGACLDALRRTRSGEFDLTAAISMDRLGHPTVLGESLVARERLLTSFPSVTLTDRGRAYVTHGREVGPEDVVTVTGTVAGTGTEDPAKGTVPAAWVRMFDSTGALVAMATPGQAPGSLHPSIVLV